MVERPADVVDCCNWTWRVGEESFSRMEIGRFALNSSP
jgi:hypothetical protein